MACEMKRKRVKLTVEWDAPYAADHPELVGAKEPDNVFYHAWESEEEERLLELGLTDESVMDRYVATYLVPLLPEGWGVSSYSVEVVV